MIAYPLSDPFEHQLPQVAVTQRVAITDGIAQQQLMLGEKRTDAQYRQQHEKQFALISSQLKQCRAKVIPISAGTPLEQQLLPQK